MPRKGEYIPLYWDGPAEWYAVHGHVPCEQAIETVAIEELIPIPKLEFTGHCFARYNPAPKDNDLGVTCFMKLVRNKGRGVFPVTVINMKEAADGAAEN